MMADKIDKSGYYHGIKKKMPKSSLPHVEPIVLTDDARLSLFKEKLNRLDRDYLNEIKWVVKLAEAQANEITHLRGTVEYWKSEDEKLRALRDGK